MNDTFNIYYTYVSETNFISAIPYKIKKINGTASFSITGNINGSNTILGYSIVDKYWNPQSTYNADGTKDSVCIICNNILYPYYASYTIDPNPNVYKIIYYNSFPLYTSFGTMFLQEINDPCYYIDYTGTPSFITDGDVFSTRYGDYYQIQYLNQQEQLNDEVDSSINILYTYTPRTCKQQLYCTSNSNDWSSILYTNTQTFPMVIQSSYAVLSDHVWPDVEFKFKFPCDFSDHNLVHYVSGTNNLTNTFNFEINDLSEDDPDKYVLIYCASTDDYGSIVNIQGSVQYSNIPTVNTPSVILPTKILANKYNTNGIMTGSVNGVYKKIVPLPDFKNVNCKIRSQITITPSTNVSYGTNIKIAIPSFVKYNGTPVNNHDYKADFGFISQDKFDIKQVISDYTDDNIFQVVGYNVYSKYIEYNNPDNGFEDVDELLSAWPEGFNPYGKEANYEESIVYQSNSCIENIFDIKFNNFNNDYFINDNISILAMRLYHNEPSYITYTLPQDVSANEDYTFEIETPITITDGIVYHIDTPFACNFSITPEVVNDLSYQTLIASVGQNINLQPTFTGNTATFSIISGTLPQELTFNTSTGTISGICQTQGLINITVGATNEFGTITAPVNINVKGKKYQVFMQDNIIGYAQ